MPCSALLAASRQSFLLRAKKAGGPNTSKKTKIDPSKKKTSKMSIKPKTSAATKISKAADSQEDRAVTDEQFLKILRPREDMTQLDLAPDIAYKRDRMEQLWREHERDRRAILEEHEQAFLKTKLATMKALKETNPVLYEEAIKLGDSENWPLNLRPPFFTPPYNTNDG